MTMQQVLFSALGGAALVALFFWFAPATAPPSAPPSAQVAAPAPLSAGETRALANTFELVVRQRQLVTGPRILAVRQGEPVVIHITNDEPEELHLHGYDLKIDLVAGQRGTLEFTADRSGRFEYELERSRVELGALEVQPSTR